MAAFTYKLFLTWRSCFQTSRRVGSKANKSSILYTTWTGRWAASHRSTDARTLRNPRVCSERIFCSCLEFGNFVLRCPGDIFRKNNFERICVCLFVVITGIVERWRAFYFPHKSNSRNNNNSTTRNTFIASKKLLIYANGSE